jgi:hypothetical protein
MKLGPIEFKPQRVAVFAGIGILLLLIMEFNARVEELSRLRREAATAQARATDVMRIQYNLQTAAAYATSDLSVEEWARQQNRMVRPGEVLVIPVPAPGTTPPSQQPIVQAPVRAPLSNWDVWMLVIFGQ